MAQRYQDYLESHHWRSKRKRILAKRGRQCQRCKAEGAVELHHASYKRIGREDGADLFVLCRACHQAFHDEYGKDVTPQNTRRFLGIVVWEKDPPPKNKKEERRYARREAFLKANPSTAPKASKKKSFRAQEHIN